MIDLAANLIKEQMSELVPVAVQLINEQLPPGSTPVTRRCVERYYRQDKLIWSLFLALRRADRWMTTTIRPNSGPDVNQTTAHWFELNTSAVPSPITLSDQGNIGDDSAGVSP